MCMMGSGPVRPRTAVCPEPTPPGGCGSRHQVIKPRLLARIAQRVLDVARQNGSASTALQRACLAKVEGACWARMTGSTC